MKVRRGPINSPKQVILAALRVGSMLEVKVRFFGSSFALVVVDAGGALAGSLTFVGYLEVVDCIRNRGLDYTATVIGIAGGVYEVRVEPV